jgi:hypothetical protein
MEGNKRVGEHIRVRQDEIPPLSLYLKQERRMVYKTAEFRDDE